jgi:uncharacterized lipoprotein YmbA
MASRLTLSVLFALLVAACQSSPSHLYVLSSQAGPSPGATVALASTGSPGAVATRSPRVLGVNVTVPEYLDRTEIVQRVGANELKSDDGAQWGEDLSVDATRVIAENLESKLSSFDVVMLPSRARRMMVYEVDVGLTRFDSDVAGKVIARGWWTITDADGQEVASGRVWQQDQANGTDYEAFAASMSRILAGLSEEIANAVEGLSRRNEAARS